MIIRVCICDDSPNELDELCQSVEKCFEEDYTNLDYKLDSFSHPDALLQQLSKDTYDLYLLDIIMPMLNGVELANEIRRISPNSLIVFVSTTTEFVTDAFSINAIHYLVKPYTFDKLKESIDRAMKRLERSDSDSVTLQVSNNNYINTLLSDIFYIESDNKYSLMHLADEDVRLRISIRELSDILKSKPSFYKLGSSFIINMNNIKQVKDKRIIMKDDSIVSIPRRIYNDFKTAYCNYFSLSNEEG